MKIDFTETELKVIYEFCNNSTVPLDNLVDSFPKYEDVIAASDIGLSIEEINSASWNIWNKLNEMFDE